MVLSLCLGVLGSEVEFEIDMIEYSIDVVIPVFDGENYVIEAIDSVRNQTVQVGQIFVVDDGSSDRTKDLVGAVGELDSRVKLISTEHSGVSAARNVGIQSSSAEFIAFLDADDIWLPDKLEHQMQAFDSGGKRVGFVHSSYFYVDEEGKYLSSHPVIPPQKKGDIFKPLLFDSYVLSGSASSVVVRRSVLVRAGCFDRDLYYGEDWDLWLRLALISWVDFTPNAVVGIRVHSESVQRRSMPQKEINHFLQKIRVFTKWESTVLEAPGFIDSLRSTAINLALHQLSKNPVSAHLFYQKLKCSNGQIGRSLFSNEFSYWSQVVNKGARYVFWRLRNKRKDNCV